MEEEAVRWNIKVSKKPTLPYEPIWARRAGKKAISKFIEEAVRWRVLDRTVQDIKAQNADTDPNKLQGLIDDAVREVQRGTGPKEESP